MLSRVEKWGLAAIALGALLWMAAPFHMDLSYDANAYVAMGDGWRRSHALTMQWGDVLTWGLDPPGPSHHFPPAYPLFLGLAFIAFGYGLAQAKAAAVVASLLALALVYATTRDLYGRERAAVVAGLVALDPVLYWVTGTGLSEGLALAFFTLTMWAILRSLTNERFIVLAGLFAGLAYVTRSSMGAFFLLAGGAGLAWRLAHRGLKRTASSGWYALGILLFAAIVAAWAWRNVSLFGWPNWETSPGTRGIPSWIRDHPSAFAQGIALRAPLLALVLAPFLVLLAPEACRSLARWREEHASGLWLSVALVWVLGIVFAAAYYSMGPSRYEALRFDNARYALVAIVPLAWALARELDFSRPATRARLLALATALVVGCALVATFPPRYAPDDAARAIDASLRPGDVVALAGVGKYAFYAYVSHPDEIRVFVDGNVPGASPQFIVSTFALERAGYVETFRESVPHAWWPGGDVVVVLAREDVAAARHLA